MPTNTIRTVHLTDQALDAIEAALVLAAHDAGGSDESRLGAAWALRAVP